MRVPFIHSGTETPDATYGLTPIGKTRSEGYLDGHMGTVISTLAEGGPQSVREVVQVSGLGVDKVKVILKRLIRMGIVKREGQGGGQPF